MCAPNGAHGLMAASVRCRDFSRCVGGEEGVCLFVAVLLVSCGGVKVDWDVF